MITIEQYFAGYPELKTDDFIKNASLLLNRVNLLLEDAQKYGVMLTVNTKTGCLISGSKNGGIRPKDCPEGSALSSHKTAQGVDIYDPSNALDGWLDDIKLLKYDLYRESAESTPSWLHVTTRPPKSSRRTFKP